jgi:hypothetical protein
MRPADSSEHVGNVSIRLRAAALRDATGIAPTIGLRAGGINGASYRPYALYAPACDSFQSTITTEAWRTSRPTSGMHVAEWLLTAEAV